MSATIIILPTVPVVHVGESVAVTVTLHRRDYNRLIRRAKEWNVSAPEAASGILENELHGRGRKA